MLFVWVACKTWAMPEQKENSPWEYEHKVMGRAWAEAFNTLCRQPHPLLHHLVRRNDAQENLPWDLLVGAHGSLPTRDMSNTAVEWWWRMQSSSLLGNTTSKTPSWREIGPTVAAFAPSKLLEALVQIIPSVVLSLDTAALRSPCQVSWHWGLPLPWQGHSSPFASHPSCLSQGPFTAVGLLCSPASEGSSGWLSTPKEHSGPFGLCCHIRSYFSTAIKSQ